jgi:hypothetical protein
MCDLFTDSITKEEQKIDASVERAISSALAGLPAAAAKLFPVSVHTKLVGVTLKLVAGTGSQRDMLVLAATTGITANVTGPKVVGPHPQRALVPTAVPNATSVVVRLGESVVRHLFSANSVGGVLAAVFRAKVVPALQKMHTKRAMGANGVLCCVGEASGR